MREGEKQIDRERERLRERGRWEKEIVIAKRSSLKKDLDF